MEKEIIEFETMLKGFSNNERAILKELQTKDQEEIYVLLTACKNIIAEQCYRTILENNLINNIKIKLLKTVNSKITEIRSEQLPVVFSSKLEIYIEKEEREIEILREISKQIENYDNEVIMKSIITILVANPKLIEQQKEQKDNMTKEKLKDLSYDKKPCINEDEIDNKVITQICKFIVEEGLKDIVLKVQTTLENDEKFYNLKTIKENTEYLVSKYYIEILEERKKSLQEYIYNSPIIKKQIKKGKTELQISQIRRILEERLNKNSVFTSEQKKSEIRSLIEKIEKTYQLEFEKNKRNKNITPEIELTKQQLEIFENTETYKEMQNRKQEDKIELSEEIFVKKIKEEMNEIAQEISNSLTEEAIANEQEQQIIKEFATHLSISVKKLIKILANDENIYLYLISNWLTNEIEKNAKIEKKAEETIRRISPKMPPSKTELAELIMKTIEVPTYLREEIKTEINKQRLNDKKLVKKIGTENVNSKGKKKKIRRNN